VWRTALQIHVRPSVATMRRAICAAATEAGPRVGRRASPAVRIDRGGRPGRGQMSFRSFHFSQIFRYFASASFTASSGVTAPVAAEANIVFSTQVL